MLVPYALHRGAKPTAEDYAPRNPRRPQATHAVSADTATVSPTGANFTSEAQTAQDTPHHHSDTQKM
ncbi:MAG: hypothetical protein ACO2PM_23615 [Pyrobaculum sp.]|jgi:hypothetical protein